LLQCALGVLQIGFGEATAGVGALDHFDGCDGEHLGVFFLGEMSDELGFVDAGYGEI
jgi:hypothetical protein